MWQLFIHMYLYIYFQWHSLHYCLNQKIFNHVSQHQFMSEKILWRTTIGSDISMDERFISSQQTNAWQMKLCHHSDALIVLLIDWFKNLQRYLRNPGRQTHFANAYVLTLTDLIWTLDKYPTYLPLEQSNWKGTFLCFIDHSVIIRHKCLKQHEFL